MDTTKDVQGSCGAVPGVNPHDTDPQIEHQSQKVVKGVTVFLLALSKALKGNTDAMQTPDIGTSTEEDMKNFKMYKDSFRVLHLSTLLMAMFLDACMNLNLIIADLISRTMSNHSAALKGVLASGSVAGVRLFFSMTIDALFDQVTQQQKTASESLEYAASHLRAGMPGTPQSTMLDIATRILTQIDAPTVLMFRDIIKGVIVNVQDDVYSMVIIPQLRDIMDQVECREALIASRVLPDGSTLHAPLGKGGLGEQGTGWKRMDYDLSPESVTRPSYTLMLRRSQFGDNVPYGEYGSALGQFLELMVERGSSLLQ